MDNGRPIVTNADGSYTFRTADPNLSNKRIYFKTGEASAESLKQFTNKLVSGSLRATEFAAEPTLNMDFVLADAPESIKGAIEKSAVGFFNATEGSAFWSYRKVGGELIYDTIFGNNRVRPTIKGYNIDGHFTSKSYQHDINPGEDSLLMHAKMTLGQNKEAQQEQLAYWSTDPKTAGVYLVNKFYDTYIETNHPQINAELRDSYKKIAAGETGDWHGKYLYFNNSIFPAILKDLKDSSGDVTIATAEFNYLQDVERAASEGASWGFMSYKDKKAEEIRKDLLQIIDVLEEKVEKGFTVTINIGKESRQTSEVEKLLASKGITVRKEKKEETHNNWWLIEGVGKNKITVSHEGSRRANANYNIEGMLRLTSQDLPPEYFKIKKEDFLERTRDISNLFDNTVFSNIRKPIYSELDSSTNNYFNSQFTYNPNAGVFYMPNFIPESFYERNRGARPTPYRDFFYGFTGQQQDKWTNAAISEMDKQLNPNLGLNPFQWRGLGAILNEKLGETLYESGGGPVATAVRGLGRLLDYTTGYYSLAQTGAATRSSYREVTAKELHRAQGKGDPDRGFFETSFSSFTNTVGSTANALAFYFGVSHSVSLMKAHMEDIGISSIMQASNDGPNSPRRGFRQALFEAYVPKDHRQLKLDVDAILKLSESADPTSKLLDSEVLESIFERSTREALAKVNVAETSIASAVNTAAADRLDALSLDSDITKRLGQIEDRMVEFFRANNAEGLQAKHLDALVTRAQRSLFGYNKAEGELSLGKPIYDNRLDTSFGSTGGFNYLSRLRKVDKSNYVQALRPLLEGMAVTANQDQRQSFRSALDAFESIVSDPPTLVFKKDKGNIPLEVSGYGFQRLEQIAQRLDEISKYIPANPLYYIPQVRQAFGINSLYIGETDKDISLKALIGPGFDTLITTQGEALRNIAKTLQTSIAGNVTNANIILRKNTAMTRMERALQKSATPDAVATYLQKQGQFSTELIANTRSIKLQENLGAYKNTRKLLGSMGAVLIADKVLDRYFMQNEGPSLIAQIAMSTKAKAKMQGYEDEQQLMQQEFTGVIPTVARMPILAAGYGMGGSLFYTADKVKTGIELSKEIAADLANNEDLKKLYGVESVTPQLLKAKLSERVRARFSYTGGAIGALALMGATQIGFNAAAAVANIVAGPGRAKGLKAEALSAIAAGKMTRAMQYTIQQERAKQQARPDTEDIDIINNMSTERRAAFAIASIQTANIFKSQTEGYRPQYTFATQIPNPIFQLALVGRLDPKGQVIAWGGGFQFLPLLGSGSIPPFPLSVRLQPPTNIKEAIGRRSRGPQQDYPSYYGIMKEISSATSPFVFDKESQFTALLALGAGVNAVRNTFEYLNKRSTSQYTKALKQSRAYNSYKPLVGLASTALSSAEKMTRWSQAPMWAAPNSLLKATSAFFAPFDREYPRVLGYTGPKARKLAPYIAAISFATAALGQGSSFDYIGTTIEAMGYNPQENPETEQYRYFEALNQARAFRAGGVIGTTAIFGASMSYFGVFKAAGDFAPDGIGAGKDLRKIHDEEIYKRFKGFQIIEETEPLRKESINTFGDARFQALSERQQIQRIGKLYKDQSTDVKGLYKAIGLNVYLYDRSDKESVQLIDAIADNISRIDKYIEGKDSPIARAVRATQNLPIEDRSQSLMNVFHTHGDEFVRISDRMEPKLIRTAPKRMSLLATAVAVPYVALALAGTVFGNAGLLESPKAGFIQGLYSVPMQIASGASASSNMTEEQIAKIKAFRNMMGIVSPENEGKKTNLTTKIAELATMPFAVVGSLFEAAGTYKDDPKEFINLLGSAGTSMGAKGWNYYTQVQAVTTDASMSRFYMQSRMFDGVDSALIESLIARDPKTVEDVGLAFQGKIARKQPMQLRGRATSSEQQAVSGVSKELVMAMNVREFQASWLANQYPGEIHRNFMFNMLTSGRVYNTRQGSAPAPDFAYKKWTPYDSLMNFAVLFSNDVYNNSAAENIEKLKTDGIRFEGLFKSLRNLAADGNIQGDRPLNFINFNDERRTQVNTGIPMISGMTDMFSFMSKSFGNERSGPPWGALPALVVTGGVAGFILTASLASAAYAASTSLSALAAVKEGGDERTILKSVEDITENLTSSKFRAFTNDGKLYLGKSRLMYRGAYELFTPEGRLGHRATQIGTNLKIADSTFAEIMSMSDMNLQVAFNKRNASSITQIISNRVTDVYSADIVGSKLFTYFGFKDADAFDDYVGGSRLAGLEAELNSIFDADISDGLKQARGREAIGRYLQDTRSGLVKSLPMNKAVEPPIMRGKAATRPTQAQMSYEPIQEIFPSSTAFSEVVASRGLKRALLDAGAGAVDVGFTALDLSQFYYPLLSTGAQALGGKTRAERLEASRVLGEFAFETTAIAAGSAAVGSLFKRSPMATAGLTALLTSGFLLDRTLNKERGWRAIKGQYKAIDKSFINPIEKLIGQAVGLVSGITGSPALQPIFGLAAAPFKAIDNIFTKIHRDNMGTGWAFFSSLFVPQSIDSRKATLLREQVGRETAYGPREYELSDEEVINRQRYLQESRFDRAMSTRTNIDYELVSGELTGGSNDQYAAIATSRFMDNKGYADRTLATFAAPNQLSGQARLAMSRRAFLASRQAASRLRSAGEAKSFTDSNNLLYLAGSYLPLSGQLATGDSSYMFKEVAKGSARGLGAFIETGANLQKITQSPFKRAWRYAIGRHLEPFLNNNLGLVRAAKHLTKFGVAAGVGYQTYAMGSDKDKPGSIPLAAGASMVTIGTLYSRQIFNKLGGAKFRPSGFSLSKLKALKNLPQAKHVLKGTAAYGLVGGLAFGSILDEFGYNLIQGEKKEKPFSYTAAAYAGSSLVSGGFGLWRSLQIQKAAGRALPILKKANRWPLKLTGGAAFGMLVGKAVNAVLNLPLVNLATYAGTEEDTREQRGKIVDYSTMAAGATFYGLGFASNSKSLGQNVTDSLYDLAALPGRVKRAPGLAKDWLRPRVPEWAKRTVRGTGRIAQFILSPATHTLGRSTKFGGIASIGKDVLLTGAANYAGGLAHKAFFKEDPPPILSLAITYAIFSPALSIPSDEAIKAVFNRLKPINESPLLNLAKRTRWFPTFKGLAVNSFNKANKLASAAKGKIKPYSALLGPLAVPTGVNAALAFSSYTTFARLDDRDIFAKYQAASEDVINSGINIGTSFLAPVGLPGIPTMLALQSSFSPYYSTLLARSYKENKQIKNYALGAGIAGIAGTVAFGIHHQKQILAAKTLARQPAVAFGRANVALQAASLINVEIADYQMRRNEMYNVSRSRQYLVKSADMRNQTASFVASGLSALRGDAVGSVTTLAQGIIGNPFRANDPTILAYAGLTDNKSHKQASEARQVGGVTAGLVAGAYTAIKTPGTLPQRLFAGLMGYALASRTGANLGVDAYVAAKAKSEERRRESLLRMFGEFSTAAAFIAGGWALRNLLPMTKTMLNKNAMSSWGVAGHKWSATSPNAQNIVNTVAAQRGINNAPNVYSSPTPRSSSPLVNKAGNIVAGYTPGVGDTPASIEFNEAALRSTPDIYLMAHHELTHHVNQSRRTADMTAQQAYEQFGVRKSLKALNKGLGFISNKEGQGFVLDEARRAIEKKYSGYTISDAGEVVDNKGRVLSDKEVAALKNRMTIDLMDELSASASARLQSRNLQRAGIRTKAHTLGSWARKYILMLGNLTQDDRDARYTQPEYSGNADKVLVGQHGLLRSVIEENNITLEGLLSGKINWFQPAVEEPEEVIVPKTVEPEIREESRVPTSVTTPGPATMPEVRLGADIDDSWLYGKDVWDDPSSTTPPTSRIPAPPTAPPTAPPSSPIEPSPAPTTRVTASEGLTAEPPKPEPTIPVAPRVAMPTVAEPTIVSPEPAVSIKPDRVVGTSIEATTEIRGRDRIFDTLFYSEDREAEAAALWRTDKDNQKYSGELAYWQRDLLRRQNFVVLSRQIAGFSQQEINDELVQARKLYDLEEAFIAQAIQEGRVDPKDYDAHRVLADTELWTPYYTKIEELQQQKAQDTLKAQTIQTATPAPSSVINKSPEAIRSNRLNPKRQKFDSVLKKEIAEWQGLFDDADDLDLVNEQISYLKTQIIGYNNQGIDNLYDSELDNYAAHLAELKALRNRQRTLLVRSSSIEDASEASVTKPSINADSIEETQLKPTVNRINKRDRVLNTQRLTRRTNRVEVIEGELLEPERLPTPVSGNIIDAEVVQPELTTSTPYKPKLLGKGAFGYVYTKDETTVRKVSTMTFVSPKEAAIQSFAADLGVAPRVTGVFISLDETNRDYMSGLEMDYVRGSKFIGPDMTMKQRISLVTQIARLHSQDIIHADLHSNNAIWTDDGVKIIDYGQAYIVDKRFDKPDKVALAKKAEMERAYIGLDDQTQIAELERVYQEELSRNAAPAQKLSTSARIAELEQQGLVHRVSSEEVLTTVPKQIKERAAVLNQGQPDTPSALKVHAQGYEDLEDIPINRGKLFTNLGLTTVGGLMSGYSIYEGVTRFTNKDKSSFDDSYGYENISAGGLNLISMGTAFTKFAKATPLLSFIAESTAYVGATYRMSTANTKEERAAARRDMGAAVGSTVGSLAGGAIGGTFFGLLGYAVGSIVGGVAGGIIGGAAVGLFDKVFSSNAQPQAKRQNNLLSNVPIIGDIFFPRAAAAEDYRVIKKEKQLKGLKATLNPKRVKSNQFDEDYAAYIKRIESTDSSFITQFLGGVGEFFENVKRGITTTVSDITQGAVDAFNWIKSGGLADLLSQNLGVFSGSIAYSGKLLDSNPIAKQIHDTAVRLGFDPTLAIALAAKESGGSNPYHIRHNRADGRIMQSPSRNSYGPFVGSMQVGWGAAVEIGYAKEDRYDQQKNIEIGIKYLDKLIKKNNGDVRRALAEYNAGGGNISAGYGYADAVLGIQEGVKTGLSAQTMTSSGANGGVIYKVTGGRQLTKADISSGYGMRFHPIRGGRRMHAGVDISSFDGKSINGANISYTKGGVVTKVAFIKGYGNSVEIKHADGTYSFSAHLLTLPPLKVGQTIEAGQIIGQVGSTGDSTGPHLHWEKRDKNYKLVDPTDSIGMVVLSRGKVKIQGQGTSQSTSNSVPNRNITVIPDKKIQSYIIQDVQTGQVLASNNANKSPASPASTIKLIVADLIIKSIKKGDLKLDTALTLKSTEIAEGSGAKAGAKMSVFSLISRMLKDSDNTSTNVLINALGGTQSITVKAKQAGYSDTFISNLLSIPGAAGFTNKSTASDVTQAALSILRGTDKASQVAAAALRQTRNFGYADEAGGKIGNNSRVIGNVGIASINGKDYLITAFSNVNGNVSSNRSIITNFTNNIVNQISSQADGTVRHKATGLPLPPSMQGQVAPPPPSSVQTNKSAQRIQTLNMIPDSALTPLRNLMFKGEGGPQSINVINRKANGQKAAGFASTFQAQFGKPAEQTTLGEIRARQQQTGTIKGKREIGAVGYPQFIGNTLQIAMNYLGLKDDTKFDMKTQNLLFKYLLFVKRPDLGRRLLGAKGSSDKAANQELAREMASIGLSYAEAPLQQLLESNTKLTEEQRRKASIPRQRGQGLYDGHNGNRASVSPNTSERVIANTSSALVRVIGKDKASIILQRLNEDSSNYTDVGRTAAATSGPASAVTPNVTMPATGTNSADLADPRLVELQNAKTSQEVERIFRKYGPAFRAKVDDMRRNPDKYRAAPQPNVYGEGLVLGPSTVPGSYITEMRGASDRHGGPRGGRKHAGQDYNVSSNTPIRTFLGGVITRVSYQPGRNLYNNYIDIYNPQLGVVERIAEYGDRRFTEKDIGRTIPAGAVIGTGSTSGPSVVHQEIRTDLNGQKQGGFGYEGTLPPLQFMQEKGIVKVEEVVIGGRRAKKVTAIASPVQSKQPINRAGTSPSTPRTPISNGSIWTQPVRQATPSELTNFRDAKPGTRVNKQAAKDLERMLADLKKETGVDLWVVSGFRSISEQQAIWDRKIKAGQSPQDVERVSAKPGYSEHHSGNAIDLALQGSGRLEAKDWETNPLLKKAASWLQKRAASYNFFMSYPKNNAQGVIFEPWHWKYDNRRSEAPAESTRPTRLSRAVDNPGVLIASSDITQGMLMASSITPGKPRESIAQPPVKLQMPFYFNEYGTPKKTTPDSLSEGFALIKAFEGLRLDVYPDPVRRGGLPYTVGYGSTRKLDGSPWKLGERLSSEQEAAALLYEEAGEKFIPKLEKIPYWKEMNSKQQSALLSFAWNLGADFYGNRNFSSLSKALKDKNWSAVPDILLKYSRAGGGIVPGLLRRRKAEAALWRGKELKEALKVGLSFSEQTSNIAYVRDLDKFLNKGNNEVAASLMQQVQSDELVEQYEVAAAENRKADSEAAAAVASNAKSKLLPEYQEVIEDWIKALEGLSVKAEAKPKPKSREINIEYPVPTFSEYRQADKSQQQVQPTNKPIAIVDRDPITQVAQLTFTLEASEADAQYNRVNPFGFAEYNTRGSYTDTYSLEGSQASDVTSRGLPRQSA